ncbi:RNA polymerase factor sigma-54, partial [bacterium]|nr:RNA polymerase factor sigma-54 [bacterium]
QMVEVLETNPVVEVTEEASLGPEISLEKPPEVNSELVAQSKEFKEQARDDFGIDWQKYIQDHETSEYRISSGGYSQDEETGFDKFVSKKSNLQDHLMVQLHESNLNTTETKIGEYLIGLLDRNGYLRITLDEISDLLKVDSQVVAKVVNVIQTMTPAGVGAYNLRGCLLLQASDEGYNNDVVTKVIEKHLGNLANNKLAIISKEEGFELEDVQAAADIIRQFNPKPGASFPTANDNIFVLPDVFVEKIDDEYVVTVNQKDLPRLRINNLYRETIKNKDASNKATYNYIREKLEAAKSFLRYVDKRQSTILNVTKAIVSVQRDFFEFGIFHLKPLTLQDVATMAGVHESTVSRATSGKYAQTPRGLFELKFFFSGGAQTQTGEDISTQVLKKRILDIVKLENPLNPLSDSEIAAQLIAAGVKIARRTIAKYRIELNIPNSSRRKHT